jgi:hypothetical protein
MSKLEELEAIRDAAVNAADADWDDAVDADTAYATAWDAIDAYKAELKKQREIVMVILSITI